MTTPLATKVSRILSVVVSLYVVAGVLGAVTSPLWLGWRPGLALVWLPAFVALDLISMSRTLAWNRGEEGPPGVAGVSWFYYVVFGYWGVRVHNYFGLRRWWMLTILALTLFHLSVQYLIPAAHKRWLSRKRADRGG